MRAMNQSVMAILAVVGMTGTVSGQVLNQNWRLGGDPDCVGPCLSCVGWAGSMTGFEMKHTVVVVDGSVTDTCANVGGIAWTWNKTEGPWTCEPVPEPQPGDETVALSFIQCSVSELQKEAYYDVTYYVASIPACVDPCSPPSDDRIWEGGAHVLGAIPAIGQGIIGLGSTSNRITATLGQENCIPDCEGTWKYDRSEFGLGVVGGGFAHDVTGGASLAVGVLVSISFTRDSDTAETGSNWGKPFVPSALCDQPRACGLDFSSGAPVAHILTASAEIVGGATLGSVTGAYVQFADGSFAKLGAFDITAFDPTDDDDFDLVIPTTSVGATSGTVDVDVSADTFPLLAGDIDGDGKICGYDDREAFMDALGSSIGDANYNLRADLDLDGDVDTDDLDDLNDIGCTADLDCDGSLTIFDQQAFSNAFDAMDPVADWDGDGSFTIFDYNEFGNTHGLGCP